jgi:hypothetical protein
LLNGILADVLARQVAWKEPRVGFSTRHQPRRISSSLGDSIT